MKRIFYLLTAIAFVAVFSCTNDSDEVIVEHHELDTAMKKKVVLGAVFGPKKAIENAIATGKTFDEINARPVPATQEWMACELPDYISIGGGPGGGGGVLKPTSTKKTETSARHWQTRVGDEYINGDDDPDAIQRYILVGDVECYDPNYDPNEYINFIVDANVPLNWKNGLSSAIIAWNDAINFNPNNGAVDRPHIYLRIRTSANPSDLGNVTVKVEPESTFASTGIVAQSNVGGLYDGPYPGAPHRWSLGKKVQINERYDDNTLSNATVVMTHEIGHIIGFRHTNQETANISGTNNTADSMMDSGAHDNFTTMDYLAIDRIFAVEDEWIIMECDPKPARSGTFK